MDRGNIHLIMPMGGAGSRFHKNGYELPKPLIDIQGKPFFYWATQSVIKFIEVDLLIFVVLQDHVNRFQIDKKIRSFYPNAIIEIIPEILNGPVLTAFEGIKNINDNKPFIINDCDHMFKCNAFYDFCNNGNFENTGGAILSFQSEDPKFSFLKVNSDNEVIGTAEKQVISNQAICGVYLFESKKTYIEISKRYFTNCSYPEYFVSGLYNILIEMNKRVIYFTVDFHVPFGTPEEYETAVESTLFKELE